MRVVMLGIAGLVLAGCKNSGCEVENCGDWCATFGGAENADLNFQSCVKNAGESGGDFILRTEEGEDVYECHIEYDELGSEVGTCSYDFMDAKYAYCGCTYSGSTYY